MARKRFDRAHRSEESKIGFTIVPIRTGFPEVDFDCEDDIPGGIVLAFSGEDVPAEADPQAGKAAEEERGRKAIDATRDLFNASIVTAQQERFWGMLGGKEGGMGVTQMMDVAFHLAGEYSADRPTGESSPSTSPPTASGLDSTDGVKVGGLTYSRSAAAALTTS
jgi:hypothetical protein